VLTILVVDGAAKVYLREGLVVVSDKEGNRLEQSIPDLELVVIIGRRILLTSAMLLTLTSNNIPIVFFDPRSTVVATLFNTIQVGSMDIRMHQYKCIGDLTCSLNIARKIVESKLKGLYNLIRYELKYHSDKVKDMDIGYLKAKILASIEEVKEARNIDELRLIEAKGSKTAWTIVAKLFPEEYNFRGRKPRGNDIINSAIDFTYAILYGILLKAIVANGLDPYAGLIHTPKPGRTSFVYDLSEIYKPLAIHSVLQASRIYKLKTYRGSSKLTPKTIEALVKQLYYRLHTLGEKIYKRKNIWIHPIKEAEKLKKTLTRNEPYKPYVYKP